MPTIDWEHVDDVLFAITQTVLAIAVVVGGGWAIITQSGDTTTVAGLVGMVIGFYFGKYVGNGNGTRVTLRRLSEIAQATQVTQDQK